MLSAMVSAVMVPVGGFDFVVDYWALLLLTEADRPARVVAKTRSIRKRQHRGEENLTRERTCGATEVSEMLLMGGCRGVRDNADCCTNYEAIT